MEEYRVVIKETKKSQNIIHENLTHSEMLQYYAKYHKDAPEKVYQLKIYRRENNSMWAVETIFENGEIVQFKDLKKEDKTPIRKARYGLDESFDFNKLFKTLFVDSAPSRREDVVALVWDYATGEDLTKPKLTTLDGLKE